jgi:DNA (cytosine-5)-methyltransferase 1
MKTEAIDLFCGIGGLTYGLRQANINVLAGLDNDKSCEYSYKKNNNCRFIAANIAEYDFLEMKKLYSKDTIKILVGCAPCQPFSSHSYKAKNREKDTRWNLINYFIKAIQVLNPHIISMENVRGISKTDVFEGFVKEVQKLGYKVDYKVVYCPDYGIPQSRSRLVLLGSKLGEIKVPQRTHTKENYVTVGDIIKRLPKIKSGGVSKKDPIHRAKNLSSLNIERIKQSKPKGSWHDWDKSLLPECYKKESGQTYTAVYGRMSWDEVSPTITTQFFNYGSGRFGHPNQDRGLSVREGALLQTFPENYDFGKEISMAKTGRHIGNAVPPMLGFIIGKAIQEHVKSQHEYAK